MFPPQPGQQCLLPGLFAARGALFSEVHAELDKSFRVTVVEEAAARTVFDSLGGLQAWTAHARTRELDWSVE